MADAEKKRAAGASVSARRGRSGAAGPDDSCRDPGARETVRGVMSGLTGGAKNVQKWLHLGGQEPAPPPVAAARRSRSAGSSLAAAAASRRRASGVAAYGADPADPAEPRRNSG